MTPARRLRVLVHPHAMEIGGSQLNAIEIGAAVRDRGHDVAILGNDGPLVDLVRSLGLEWIPLTTEGRSWPARTAAATRQLHELTRSRGLDVVHGYEWPPGVNAFLSSQRRIGAASVCTVMSAHVAPFLPRTMSLVVGTAATAEEARRAGFRAVTLLEPPVDIVANSPDFDGSAFRAVCRAAPGVPLVVVVCRLAKELKLEGLLAAAAVAGELNASGTRMQLTVVGDGPARSQVQDAADKANANAGREVVVLTGQLDDPRPAYAAADIMLGMGGSALRGLAFAKPLIVQGERGFWKLLTPDTVQTFLDGGWYGLSDGRPGEARLRAILRPLLHDTARQDWLGAFGRQLVVDRFSLGEAARTQERVYLEAISAQRAAPRLEVARTVTGVLSHKVRRKVKRLTGTVPTADFNAVKEQK